MVQLAILTNSVVDINSNDNCHLVERRGAALKGQATGVLFISLLPLFCSAQYYKTFYPPNLQMFVIS
jgi:hypothetical protein